MNGNHEDKNAFNDVGLPNAVAEALRVYLDVGNDRAAKHEAKAVLLAPLGRRGCRAPMGNFGGSSLSRHAQRSFAILGTCVPSHNFLLVPPRVGDVVAQAVACARDSERHELVAAHVANLIRFNLVDRLAADDLAYLLSRGAEERNVWLPARAASWFRRSPHADEYLI